MPLDPEEKIWVWWNADIEDKSIVFKIQSKAKGWSAVGFSPNGGMKGSDMLFFWADRAGKPNIQVSSYIFRRTESYFGILFSCLFI